MTQASSFAFWYRLYMLKTVKHIFSMFYSLIKHGFLTKIFKISIYTCLHSFWNNWWSWNIEELGTGSSTDDFAVVCDAKRSFDFDLVWSFTHLGDGRLELVADNGVRDSSCWKRKINCHWNLWLGHCCHFKILEPLFSLRCLFERNSSLLWIKSIYK